MRRLMFWKKSQIEPTRVQMRARNLDWPFVKLARGAGLSWPFLRPNSLMVTT